jgi:alpha-beta hydrolase superfamily lysophospholipase
MNGPCIPDQQEILESQGCKLYVEHFTPSSAPRLALVMVHGFGAHCGLYRHVAGFLKSQGVAVTGFDARGHGRSQGRRGHVDRFDDYQTDLALVAQAARARSPGTPWALMGHSMGGAVALDHALRGCSQPSPDRLILVAPWLELKMKVSMPKRAAAEVFARLKPTLSIANGLKAEDISRNPMVVEKFYDDPLVHHVATAGWFAGVLRAQAAMRASAAQLTVPTLLVLAGQDRIVSTDTALAFAQQAGDIVTVRRYEALFHEMFLEPERDLVLADIAQWLRPAQA